MDLHTMQKVVILILVAFAAAELAAGRFLFRRETTLKDAVLDGVSVVAIPGLIVPFVLVTAAGVAERIAPGSRGALGHLPGWVMFGVLLVADDLSQYLWHRLSHESWLFPLHRAHHSATYLSVRVVYRNNLVYYLLMPGLWFSAFLLYWGFAPVYAWYAVAKIAVIAGAHSSLPWDAPLYTWPPTRRLMWLVERVISTPATHAAHHGLNAGDGITHYRGNYGNFLFLWDVLFGTALITRRRPAAFGLEDLEPVGLIRELVIPVPARRLGAAGGGPGQIPGDNSAPPNP